MKNKGKIFEDDVKSSIPSHCLLIRLPDPPQSFVKSKSTRFSHKNPCDYVCYNSEDKRFWCIECKTTASKSISFESIYEDVDYEKMIHKHQTVSLLKFSEYEGVISGFLFNFRHFENSDKYNETTYFMEVNDFQKMCDKIDKKSFNEIDAILNGAVKVSGNKKRTRYKWDLESLFRDYNK